MQLTVRKASLKEIERFRLLFLQENTFQIRFNKCHERGWSDSYIISLHDNPIGYGSIKGLEQLSDRDAVFEFYLIPPYRKMRHMAFSKLIAVSEAKYIECQSNDVFLTALLYQFAQDINAEAILFADYTVTDLRKPEVTFRPRRDGDNIFDHNVEPVGDYVLEKNGEIVATGGLVLSYNMPFADLYMEVKEDHRHSGYGSFLVQELKKQSYQSGRVPAARCDVRNVASQATLVKAGLKVCGYVLYGAIRAQFLSC